MAIFWGLGKLLCLHWSKQPAPQPASGSLLQAATSAVNFHYLPLAVTLGDKHPYKACRFSSFYLFSPPKILLPGRHPQDWKHVNKPGEMLYFTWKYETYVWCQIK